MLGVVGKGVVLDDAEFDNDLGERKESLTFEPVTVNCLKQPVKSFRKE